MIEAQSSIPHPPPSSCGVDSPRPVLLFQVPPPAMIEAQPNIPHPPPSSCGVDSPRPVLLF